MPEDPQSKSLSDPQMSIFASVLDVLIPASEDGALPAAGEIGLGETICQRAEELLPVLSEALDALEERVAALEVENFDSLPAAEKRPLLEAVAAEHPAFLPALLFQTFSNYYQDSRVLRGLGLEARPPYPLGYDLEAGDLDLLEPVRRRGTLYRDC